MKPIRQLTMNLSRQYAKLYPRDMFIAVVDSLDKTPSAQAAAAVLSQKYKTLLIKPSELFKLNPFFKKVVLDISVPQKGDGVFDLSLVKPKIALFTRISHANEVLQETGRIVESLGEDGVVLLNWDDPKSKKLAQNCTGDVIYYGSDPQNCTVWVGNIKIENFTTTFELNLGVERVKVNFRLLGSHQVYPALAAAALGVICEVPLTKIKIALESILPKEHHLQALVGPNGSLLLDDSQSGTPSTIEGAIDTLLAIPARRRVICLAQMRELGKYSEQLHRQVAQRIYKEKLDLVFLGQGDAQFIAMELKSLGFWEERMDSNLKNSELVSRLLKTLGKGDVCLIAGSQAVRLDEVVKRIAKKQ